MHVHTRAQELVGRAGELARIDEFLVAAGASSAALVIEGEAGIGKTTLWSAGVERAREGGFRLLVARPAVAERDLSFAALADLLADAHEEIRQLPPQQQRPLVAALLLEDARGAPPEPRAIAVGLLAMLRRLARDVPLLVAVDDIQWVDAPSATALAFALRRAVDESVSVLVAERTGVEADLPLKLDRSLPVERVLVGPLSLGAIQRVVRDTLGENFPRPVLRRIQDRSAGNPFFALELARALQARGGAIAPGDDLPVPDELRRLVANRLAALPAETTEPLAAVAALAEPRFELIDDSDALEPAFAAGVVLVDADSIRFSHPLLAAAAYEALTPLRRRALHRSLAGVVEDSEQRARHLALGAEGPDPRLAAVLDEAAAHAHARGAPEAAADLAERALRLGDPESAARRAAAAAEYHMVAGDDRRAQELLDDALPRAPRGPGRARLLYASALCGGETSAGIGFLEEARLEAVSDPALEAKVLAELSNWITTARRIPDGEPYARAAVTAAEQVGDPALLAHALSSLAMNEFWLGRGFPRELMQRALALDPDCESLPVEARPVTVFGWMCKWAGDIDRSRALLDEARRIGEERGDSTVTAPIYYSSALELIAENWHRGLELAEEVHEGGIEGERDQVALTGLCLRCVLLAHLGDDEGARRDAAEVFAIEARVGTAHAIPLAGWALALLELSLDRPAAALEHARRATLNEQGEGVEEPALYFSFPIHAEAAIGVGELDEAEELLDWIEERAVRLDREWALACGGRCRGLLAAARGDEAGAVVAFERALAEHERVQYRRFDLARTLLAQGEVLRRFKKKRDARQSIEEANEIFDGLGAKLWAAKAHRELARISGRRSSQGLTETERRVAELVAAGRSNKEVASELFITVRTVEAHLTKVYAKLDVRSRTELASRLS